MDVEGVVRNPKALEASTLSQSLKLLLSPFFATRVINQHVHIAIDRAPCGKAAVRRHGENALRNSHFSVYWKCLVAILQDFQAMLVVPIMTNPL